MGDFEVQCVCGIFQIDRVEYGERFEYAFFFFIDFW